MVVVVDVCGVGVRLSIPAASFLIVLSLVKLSIFMSATPHSNKLSRTLRSYTSASKPSSGVIQCLNSVVMKSKGCSMRQSKWLVLEVGGVKMKSKG